MAWLHSLWAGDEAAQRLPRSTVAARWAQLVLGLFLVGLAVALMVRSGLGLGPWDAFHVGIHRWTGISIGTASILVGLAILVGTWFIGVRPGPGTVANMLLIGIFIDLLLPWVPPARGWLWGLSYYLPAIGLAGIATGMYIASGLGKGPRDGLMIVLSQRTGWPIRRVRTLIELAILGLGWWMGGTVGIGTLLFTLTIGPAVQWGLDLFGYEPPLPIAAKRAEISMEAQPRHGRTDAPCEMGAGVDSM